MHAAAAATAMNRVVRPEQQERGEIRRARHRQRRTAAQRDQQVDLPHRRHTREDDEHAKQERLREGAWEKRRERAQAGGDDGHPINRVGADSARHVRSADFTGGSK